MIKWILGIAVAILVISGVIYFVNNSKNLKFESVCLKNNQYYNEVHCSNVGKRAYSLPSVAALNQKDYGPIVGVSWRKVGSLISAPGRKQRRSKQNAYYYIIGHDKNPAYQLLMLTSQVEVVDAKE